MNTKALIPLVLAVLLGLAAAFMVKNVIARRSASPQQSANLVTVVAAKQNVDPGHMLGKDDVAITKVPADAAPGQVFSDPTQLIGRVVTVPLVKGQTILETLLAPTGAGSGLQALVPPGMRAMTFEVTEYSGVGGMLQPGCRVDIISLLHDEKKPDAQARTVLQNIKIQAVGHNTSNAPPAEGQQAPPPSNAITVLCTPKQSQLLQLALSSGRPWLVLRSGQDGKELPLEGTTMAELRGDTDATASIPTESTIPTEEPAQRGGNNDPFANQPPQAAIEPTPAPVAVDAPPALIKRVVQVLRGGAETQVTFVVPNPRAATADITLAPDAH